MNKNTKARLKEHLKEQKRLGKRTSGYKARKHPYPQTTTRPDLANTSGYDSKGKYIGKPWSQCW